MHIAFNGWFWDQPHTGSGQYLRNLLAALHEVAPQHRLSLIVPDHVRTLDHLPPDVDVLPISARFRGDLGKVWFEQRAFPRGVARLSANIAHVPYWGPPLTCTAPMVCTVLDVIPLIVPEYRSGFKTRLYTSLVVAAARGAGHLVTISNSSKRDIARRVGIPEERITVTYLAADSAFGPEIGRERDQAVRARYGLTDLDDFVLYLGSFAVHKNVRLLLAAYTYVAQGLGPDVPLVLAGHTPAAWGTPRFPDLPGYIAEIGLTSYVRWIGPVDEADKPALYRMASVFVFPSRYEGFGLGPLEAMASGTPVVACTASSIPEVVGDAAFLVDPGDSRAMGGAILSLILEPDHAALLRRRGLARAREFSWRRTAEATLAVYKQLTGP
jgi:glycosyltransferase involved in cell wall biosynthesis